MHARNRQGFHGFSPTFLRSSKSTGDGRIRECDYWFSADSQMFVIMRNSLMVSQHISSPERQNFWSISILVFLCFHQPFWLLADAFSNCLSYLKAHIVLIFISDPPKLSPWNSWSMLWSSASPNVSSPFSSKDSQQVQCLRAYMPRENDELALEKADVVMVTQQSSDGKRDNP